MSIKEITSLKDAKIQFARSLNSAKGRINSQKFLIEGIEAINWAINFDIKIDYIVASKQLTNLNENILKYDLFYTSDGILKKITDTNYLIPIIAIGQLNNNFKNKEFVIVLDSLKDYGNIGTIIRTCHAFGIDSIISTKNDIDLFQRKTVDASRGRVFATNFKNFNTPLDTISYLKSNNFKIIATSPYGENLQSLITLSDNPVALIIGNETNGVAEEFIQYADYTVQIPMQSNMESLNVGVATGISIYELKLKQVLGMIEKKIKSTLGREINVASMLIRDALDKELKKVSDLTSTQLVFLMVLKCDNVLSIIDAQKQFGLPDKELDSFFEPLSTKALISINSNNNLLITEKGIEVIGKLWSIIENAENSILIDFSNDEKVELKRLINKLKNNCVKIINE